MRKRLMACVAVLGVFLALSVTAAVSATPRNIYRDLSKHGRLGQYSVAELKKASQNPTFQGYHKPTQVAPNLVRRTTGRKPKTGGLPFTGLDLTFIAASAILLVLVGGGLRILVRKS